MKTFNNEASEKLRGQIAAFLTNNLDSIQQDFKNLHPRYRIKLYCAMLQYELPRLRAIKSGIDFSQMTELQLDQIIDELRKTITSEDEQKRKN